MRASANAPRSSAPDGRSGPEPDDRPTASAAESAARPDRPRGLAGVLAEEEFSVADAIGGPRGIAESVLPTLLFVVLYVTTREVLPAALAAGAVVAIALIARLVQRQNLGPAMGGLIGVALGGVLAVRSGQGSDFYLPGILINAVSLLVLLGSIILRQPLIGVLIGLIDQRVADWREHADSRAVYTRATWLFAGLYAAKLLVQVPLLLSGATAALGVAKIAMGLPLFAVLVYLVWLMHRAVLARRAGAARA